MTLTGKKMDCNFKIACCTVQYMFEGIDIADAIKSIAKLGFEAVELVYGEDFATNADQFPDIRYLKKTIDENNLKICTFASSLWWGVTGEIAKKNRNLLKRSAQAAVELGAGLLKICSGFYTPFYNREDTWKYIIENFSWAADMAENTGIKLAVEPVAAWPLCNTDTFIRMRKETGKNIYMNIDPSSLVFEGEDPAAVVRRHHNLIAGVHLKDSRYKNVAREDIYPWMLDLVRSHHLGEKQSHVFKGVRPAFTPMGEGDIDIARFLEALVGTGYDGYLVIEYEGSLCGYGYSAEEASKKSLVYINKIISEINDKKGDCICSG